MKEQKHVEARCIGEEWEVEYRKKLMTAEEAVKLIKPGDRVVAPFFSGEILSEALAARKDELKDITIHSSMIVERALGALLEEGMEDVFRTTAEIFVGDWARESPLGPDSKHLQFWPGTFSTMMKPFDERPDECPYTIDVVMVILSKPDKDGFCSFGSSLWNKRSYCKRAKTVIAEVTEDLIRTGGTNFIHISELDAIIEVEPDEEEEMSSAERRALWNELLAESEPGVKEEILAIIPEIEKEEMQQRVVENLAGETLEDVQTRIGRLKQMLNLSEPDPVAVAIAQNVSKMIKDGDTFQIGTGFPSQQLINLGAFEGKKDLGIYSEMGTRGFGDLVRSGIVTGKYKTFHPGKVTVTSFMGCREEDHDFIDGNPIFEQLDAEFVLDIRNISQNDNFVAINNAVSVDLTGQINVETSVGARLVNGHGGLPEMHIGALLSKGGRALTLLPSTALQGTISRIVPQLDKGAIVTIPRYFADYIITEYGIANLMGKDARQRAEALIEVAHPDFRGMLREAAKELFYP